MQRYDLAVAGGGPAGCLAALAALARGARVVVFDRAKFPRHKVCGDCLNPAVWSVLRNAGLAAGVAGLPGMFARRVQFFAEGKCVREVSLPEPTGGEFVVRRELLDAFLLGEVSRRGADVRTGCAVRSLRCAREGWELETEQGTVFSRTAILADGRNSPTARSLGLLPTANRGLTGWQAHTPLPKEFHQTIAMFFFEAGYGGIADCGAGLANLCMVCPPHAARAMQKEVCKQFGIPGQDWRWASISPIHRSPARVLATDGLFLAGDVARVVEPFTGEGIAYAMRTGALAGECALLSLRKPGAGEERYRVQHRSMYLGRLWVNRLSRLAGQHAWFTCRLLRSAAGRLIPIGFLTRKVIARK